MKIDESQLNYVTQRTTQYDRKYGMLKNLLESIGRVDSAVELFGGIGLNSRYIQTYCSPKNHLAIEQDPDCFGFLTKSGVHAINDYCFTYTAPDTKVDLLVVDAVFNERVYDEVTELINKYDFTHVLIVNTGVFHVRFDKKLTYDMYWNGMIDRLCSKLNARHVKTLYDMDFGMMLFTRDESQPNELTNYVRNIYRDTDWREMRSDILGTP
jgi:hypothetical protein